MKRGRVIAASLGVALMARGAHWLLGGGEAPAGAGALLSALLAPAAAAVAWRLGGFWTAAAAGGLVALHPELIRLGAAGGVGHRTALLALAMLGLIGAWLARQSLLASGAAGLVPWLDPSAWPVGLVWLGAHWREARPRRPWTATVLFLALALPSAAWALHGRGVLAPSAQSSLGGAAAEARNAHPGAAIQTEPPRLRAPETPPGAVRPFVARAATGYAERLPRVASRVGAAATPPLLALAALGLWLAYRRERAKDAAKVCLPLVGLASLPFGAASLAVVAGFVPVFALLASLAVGETLGRVAARQRSRATRLP